jgi:multidrug efflux pump
LLSQVLTLYTTPVIYIFFDKLGQKISGKSESKKGVDTEHPAVEAPGKS